MIKEFIALIAKELDKLNLMVHVFRKTLDWKNRRRELLDDSMLEKAQLCLKINVNLVIHRKQQAGN